MALFVDERAILANQRQIIADSIVSIFAARGDQSMSMPNRILS